MTTFAVTAAGAPTSLELARMTGVAWEALVPVPAPRRERETITCLERVVEAVAIDPRRALDVDHADDLHYLRWWVRRATGR